MVERARRARRGGSQHATNLFNTSTAMISCCRKGSNSRFLVCDNVAIAPSHMEKPVSTLTVIAPLTSHGSELGSRFRRCFLPSLWWGTSTPLYRREVTDRAGPWTTLKNEEDWEYDCRIASKGIRLHSCEAFVS